MNRKPTPELPLSFLSYRVFLPPHREIKRHSATQEQGTDICAPVCQVQRRLTLSFERTDYRAACDPVTPLAGEVERGIDREGRIKRLIQRIAAL